MGLRDETLDQDLSDYYNRGKEPSRLAGGGSQLEFTRTKRILADRLPQPPCRILDVGGGAGPYAFWLAGQGYSVDLIDAVPMHIEMARGTMSRTGAKLASLAVGDARNLAFKANRFDAVLMLGPLYHLTKRDDRLAALREAHRVLSPNGTLFAAAITRYGSLLDGFFKDFVSDPEFVPLMRQDLIDGQHRNPTHKTGYFTTAFFHHPDELKSETRDADFALVSLLRLARFAGHIPGFSEKWQNESYRQLLLEVLAVLETDESIVGFSSHIMAVARKPA